ncbi:MAG: hypothetical protein FWH47_01675 [Methanomassiliicoccaceae archaeon]|nr:hypothetical protein [Methanomassiliicoccaceae archaeon]
MERKEYERLCESLRGPDDIERLSEEGYNKGLLVELYGLKTNRHIQEHKEEIKSKAPDMHRACESGRSIVDIARDYSIFPTYAARLIFEVAGVSEKEFKRYKKDPDSHGDPRVAE